MLIDFGDCMRPMVNFVERCSTRMLVRLCIDALSYSSALLHGIITDSEVSPRVLWLSDDISEVCLMLERFESINQGYMDCASKINCAMEAWIAAMSSDTMRQSSKAVDRIKSELSRRQVLGLFEEYWSIPRIECLAQIASIKPYAVVCEFQYTGKVSRNLMLSFAPKPALSFLTDTSLTSNRDSFPHKTRKNYVGEDRTSMIAPYAGTFRIDSR